MPFFQQVSDKKNLYHFFIYVVFLQAFAKTAKLVIISMKLARRTRNGNPREKCDWQMRKARGGKTRKSNEKLCRKIIPHK
jgi:hypothetical protein